ncbi:MAG: hypothetical protein LBN00_11770 [Oscillospiraceae bacterium]|jgi:hypothetical protein|nr:hypothetical protein [Oscillospiraceae bacterium]
MAAVAVKKETYVYAEAIPQELPRAIPRAIPKPAHKPRISAFSVLGFLFIGLLAVVCMLSQVELTRISTEITGVREIKGKVKAQTGITEKLTALQEENRTLKIEYERAFDLNAIEVYATRELGMVKSSRVAARTVAAAPSDYAVIPASEQGSALQEIKDYFTALAEYFK